MAGTVDYATVPVIDFSPEGRAELAPQVRDAMHTDGFVCIVNYGVTQAQNDRMVDIADVPFSAVAEEEQSWFLSNHPRTEDEEAKTKNVWMKGHTDGTTISLLWSQPVVALRIMSPDGKWRHVKYVPNSIIVNAGDAMGMLSGGYYKATIHRVVQPPADQRGHTRLGMFYFAFADDDVRLVPFKESPVLQRVGIIWKCDDEDAPTMKMWGSMRASTFGNAETERKGNGVKEQVVNGIAVKYYN